MTVAALENVLGQQQVSSKLGDCNLLVEVAMVLEDLTDEWEVCHRWMARLIHGGAVRIACSRLSMSRSGPLPDH